jgi:amidohydrolase
MFPTPLLTTTQSLLSEIFATYDTRFVLQLDPILRGHLSEKPEITLDPLNLCHLPNRLFDMPTMQIQPTPGHDTQKSQRIVDVVEEFRPNIQPFEEHYRKIHQDPELSTQEAQTGKIMADYLRSLQRYSVIDSIGGHGVVGLLENGPGRSVLLRAELDALPVQEMTGLPYASTKHMIDTDGVERPVMHACGHDMHLASLMGAASLLAAAKDRWNGRLLIVFQPNEERGWGAQAMISDGLYGPNGVPPPDVVLGQHIGNNKAGVLEVGSGPALAGKRAIRITIPGRGGHASTPHSTVDPIVTACHIVIRLQTIVSREVNPNEMVVLTVGTIHAGVASNVIPDQAEFTVDIRTYSKDILLQTVESMKRIVKAECLASGTEDEPRFVDIENVPPLVNSVEAAAPLKEHFENIFGGQNVQDRKPGMASDDFSILAPEGVPYAFWSLGSTERATWEKHEKEGRLNELPDNHSPYFKPTIQPTLTKAIDALAVAALVFLDLKT